jgi:hypothetical protein
MKLIVTRFSIPGLLPTGAHKVRDEERLEFKFNVFEKLTKPSVLSQTDENFTWHIFAGKFLQDRIKIDDSRITVHYVSLDDFRKQCQEICNNTTTVRLDDDDGISPLLLESLDNYSEGVVSFPRGRQFSVIDNNIVFSETPTFQPNVSAGMARINGNIYECGNHAHIHTRFNVIYDNLEDAYYQCCSEYCWSQRRVFM